MNAVGITSEYERVGLIRHPEDGEIEIDVYPAIRTQGKTGHVLIQPSLDVAISVNARAPTPLGGGHYTWVIDDIAGQRILLRHDGGTAGSIPEHTEATIWAE